MIYGLLHLLFTLLVQENKVLLRCLHFFKTKKIFLNLPTDRHSVEWKWLHMWLLLGMWYIFSYSDIFSPQRAVLDFRLSEPSWYTVGIVLMLGTIAVYLASRKTWSKWTVVTVTNNWPLCKLWETEYQLSTSELNDYQ